MELMTGKVKPKTDEVSDAITYKWRTDAALGLAAQAYMKGTDRSRTIRSSNSSAG